MTFHPGSKHAFFLLFRHGIFGPKSPRPSERMFLAPSHLLWRTTRYACPCVLIDQDDADVLRLVILLINGMVPTDNSGRVIMEEIR